MELGKWKKWLIRSGLVLSVAVPSFSAMASYSIECDDTYLATNMDRYTPTFKKSSLTVKYKNSFNECILDRSDKVRHILQRQVSKRQSIEDDLRLKLDSAIRNSLNSTFSVRYTSLDLAGAMTVRLSPDSSGKIKARIGGFTFSSKTKIKLNKVSSGLFKAYATVSTGRLWASADYDLYTGTISNIQVEPVKLNVDVDASILGISLFGLNNLFEDVAKKELYKGFHDYINSGKLNYTKSLFSLDSFIPNGEFLYAGQDLGVKVKDSLVHMLDGQSIQVTAYGEDIEGASLHATFADRLSFSIEYKTIENACYIYSDRPCEFPSGEL